MGFFDDLIPAQGDTMLAQASPPSPPKQPKKETRYGIFDDLIPGNEKVAQPEAVPQKAPTLWEQIKAGLHESPLPNWFGRDPGVAAAQAEFDKLHPMSTMLDSGRDAPGYGVAAVTPVVPWTGAGSFAPQATPAVIPHPQVPRPDPQLNAILQTVGTPLRVGEEIERSIATPEGAAMAASFAIPTVGVPLALARAGQFGRAAVIAKMAVDAPKNIQQRLSQIGANEFINLANTLRAVPGGEQAAGLVNQLALAQDRPLMTSGELGPAALGSAVDIAMPVAGFAGHPTPKVTPEILSWRKIRPKKKPTPPAAPPEEMVPPVPAGPPPAPIFQKPALQPEVPQGIKFATGGGLEEAGKILKLAKAKGELPEIQESLTPKSRLILRDSQQLKLTPDAEGKYDAGQVAGRLLKSTSEGERTMLKDAGIGDVFKPGERTTLAEVDQWVADNGPRVEIKANKPGDVTKDPLVVEFRELEHKLDTYGAMAMPESPGWQEWTSKQVAQVRKDSPEIGKMLDRYRGIENEVKLKVKEKGAQYGFVGPKAETEMPGYVEISVATPTKVPTKTYFERQRRLHPETEKFKAQHEEAAKRLPMTEMQPQYPARHGGFPPNTLGWTRGYMETRKDGGKTFHIIELQSDWANKIKELEGEKAKGGLAVEEFQRELDRLHHPLLKEYERIALKAAIDHAKKEGADRIAVSDAETAMLTQKHDQAAMMIQPIESREVYRAVEGEDYVDKHWTTDRYAGKDVEVEGEFVKVETPGREELILRIDKPKDNEAGYVEIAEEIAKSGYGKKGGTLVPQEKGMQVNYGGSFKLLDPEGKVVERFPTAEDAAAYARANRLRVGEGKNEYQITQGKLPQMLEELTGKKGKMVEYGEHKEAPLKEPAARETARGINQLLYEEHGIGREPYFTERTGEPKTSITAKEFGLEDIGEAPYSVSGTRLYTGLDFSVFREGYRDLKRFLIGIESDLRTMRTAGGTHESKVEILNKRAAVDNDSYIVADRIGKSIELAADNLFGKKIKQEALDAIPAALEAGGNIRKLADFERRAAKNKDAVRTIQFARNNWAEMQKLVKAVKAFDRQLVATAKRNGMKMSPIKDLIASAYEYSDRGVFFGKRQEMGITPPPRSFASVFHAIEAKHDPLTFDGARLLRRRASEVLLEVNKRFWTESLKTMRDPTGTKIYREIKRSAKIPDGYEKIMGLPGVVLRPYASMFDAITSTSRISGSHLGKAALEVQGAVKHGLLAIDTFHLGRISFFRKSLGVKGLYKRGLSILEYAQKDLANAVSRGLAPKDAVAYAETPYTLPQGTFTNRELANRFIKGGLNVAKHGEALYTTFIRSIPIVKQSIGWFNKLVFEKVGRGAMIESALIEFQRLGKAYPHKTTEQLITQISKDINFRFGNVGLQGVFKSRTMQDITQLAFLAPKWVESMLQSEIRSGSQLLKYGNPFGESFGTRNTLARSTGNLILFYVGLTQFLNWRSTGHGTWDNEEGHRMDAWIPPLPQDNVFSKALGITTPNKGFWFNPLSTVAEISHDVIRYTEQGKDPTQVISQIVSNKLSTFSRGIATFISGRDWAGVKADGAWDRVIKSVVAYLDPTPLPFRQAYAAYKQKELAPFERQAFGMTGTKIEPESTQSQMARLTKGMPIGERLKREKELKTKREQEFPRPEMVKIEGAARAMEGNYERAKEITSGLSKGDQQWMESRGLKIPGFSDTLRLGGDTIHTSKEESEFLKAEVKKEIIEGMKDIRSKTHFDKLPPEQRADFFNSYMRGRIHKAEHALKMRIQSLSKTEKH